MLVDVMAPETGHVCTVKQAEEYLAVYDEHYLIKIDACTAQILDNKECWDNIFDLEDEIKSKQNDMHTLYPIPKAQEACDCLLFNHLHDLFMPIVYKEFEETDQWYFNASLDLADITAEQLGAPPEYAVPLLAAVVELASLDCHKSPLQKMQCLCTTYDFIFAELKVAIINVISKSSSGRECEIPVVNNSDIIPILITVIVKSKLMHLYSNFYYINTFLGCLNENSNFRHVLNEFEVAILKMMQLSKDSLRPSSVDTNKSMDLCKFINVTSDFQKRLRQDRNEMTPLDNHIHNVTELIITSTNEYQVLPKEKG